MRIVVTGATGTLGTSVIRQLDGDARVDDIVGLVRRPPDPTSASSVSTKTQWVPFDVVRDDPEPHLRLADVLVHLAWAIQPAHEPETLQRTNVAGTRRLLDAANRVGVGAIVHASSSGVYSPGPRDQRVDEDWPTDGIATLPYSAQKAYVERLLDAFELRHPGTRVVRIRPALIFAAHSGLRYRALFTGPLLPAGVMPDASTLERLLPLQMQAVHAEDAADAFVRAALGDVRGAFNVAAEPVLGRDIPPASHALRSLTAVGFATRLVRADPGWIDLARALPLMGTGRARTELGWEPRIDAHAAFAEVIGGIRTGAHDPTPALATTPAPADDASPRPAGAATGA